MPRAHSSFILPPSSLFRRGFSLTEILIVIGIIVLVILLAVPALSLMTGARSIDGAENNLAAALGRTRADAIGVQEIRGVLFFLEPDTQRVTAADVRQVAPPAGAPAGIEVYLDLVADRDFITLPKGVMLQTIDNSAMNDGTDVRGDDAYIGFNVSPAGALAGAEELRFGGVILFDDKGQVTGRSYAFRGTKVNASGTTVPTDIINLLSTGKITEPAPAPADFIPTSAPGPLRSQYGMVLFDAAAFADNWTLSDSQVDPRSKPNGADVYTDSATPGSRSAEANEERWIDENSTPLLINRYNGTLVRGE